MWPPKKVTLIDLVQAPLQCPMPGGMTHIIAVELLVMMDHHRGDALTAGELAKTLGRDNRWVGRVLRILEDYNFVSQSQDCRWSLRGWEADQFLAEPICGIRKCTGSAVFDA